MSPGGQIEFCEVGFHKDDLNSVAEKMLASLRLAARTVADPDDGAPLMKPGCTSRHLEPAVAIESALAWLRVGGRIVLVGSVFSSPPIALDPETVVRRMLSISGLHNYRPDDLAEALAFLAELPADAPSRSLAGCSYPLSEIDQAVTAADSNEHLRVVITPNA